MPRRRQPKAASDGDISITPITAKERRDLDKSIKKKYDRFRRRSWSCTSCLSSANFALMKLSQCSRETRYVGSIISMRPAGSIVLWSKP
jgi:hypothetical protein